MERFTYQNFDVIFARKAEGEYSANVSGAIGDGDVVFALSDIQAALAGEIAAANDEAIASRHLVFSPLNGQRRCFICVRKTGASKKKKTTAQS